MILLSMSLLKLKLKCILHFVWMPIKDPFMDCDDQTDVSFNDDVVPLSATEDSQDSKHALREAPEFVGFHKFSFFEYGNPLIALAAFLVRLMELDVVKLLLLQLEASVREEQELVSPNGERLEEFSALKGPDAFHERVESDLVNFSKKVEAKKAEEARFQGAASQSLDAPKEDEMLQSKSMEALKDENVSDFLLEQKQQNLY
ncbi:hypothetical protein POM88_043257 [Heracleum sosnowskyi]|uniref:Uncharacterized protein n=1 Tax=Heracleum sosnowskyi TaxID=360622 RepID=A0AAD8H321_9APIA|nr:hypothetical protein POM88_043257 [Heracleum sosnowskyi]